MGSWCSGRRVLLPEWLCGIASSAPLQTWLLHGGSSWGCELMLRVREEENLGPDIVSGGDAAAPWLTPVYAGLLQRDLLRERG